MEQKTILTFEENEIILQQGSTLPQMYKILSGKAEIYFNYKQPDEHLIGILSEQRCFGELSILCDKPITYTVVALTQVMVLCITKDSFNDFIKNNPQNAIDIMKNLANTVNLLSLNLHLLNEDMAAIESANHDLQKVQELSHKVLQYSSPDSISKALFSASV